MSTRRCKWKPKRERRSKDYFCWLCVSQVEPSEQLLTDVLALSDDVESGYILEVSLTHTHMSLLLLLFALC